MGETLVGAGVGNDPSGLGNVAMYKRFDCGPA